eukprot:CAMPEP_0185608590 /NCGR_PEP_ID=MMETSP0436-20130131/7707_1 /TAXON_ID=626734 ORGANISM="Favella taraikaensis, Strain Fe Narragansett Bay" /NCGR_SAMPLE_ID=MMETSP0436 /ASSEMBLY_ACC=CAM_ASM_000390 /LENGTH=82 /DNA_ID=CAMNT_0028240815 /DNA_START=437 /DNA_END=682 /DNA_ORIENTATION=+
MSVVSETALVLVAQVRHDSVDSAQETLIFLDNEKLIAATTEASDRLAEVLGEDLERSVRLFAANEDLANLGASFDHCQLFFA